MAGLSGLVLSFGLIQPGTWLAAWVGLAPLLLAIRSATPAQAAVRGLVAGFVYYGVILYWIILFGALPWFLLVIYQAAYIALFAVVANRLWPERLGWLGFLGIPAAWSVTEYLRMAGVYGFAWGSLAHTQSSNLPFLQASEFAGPCGISFALVFLNLAIAYALSGRGKRRLLPLSLACLIVAVMCVYGFAVMRSSAEETTRHKIAIIQANMRNDFNPVPNYPDVAYERFSAMTRAAADGEVRLALWPETSIPRDITSPGWADMIGQIASECQVDLLAGGYDHSDSPGQPGSYNALFHFGKDGRVHGGYRKVQLVPFGEFVPLRDKLPMLKKYGIREEDVLPARKHVLLDTAVGRIGISICFESIFPEIARKETLEGAEVLCVVTNDAWFGRTQAARQHLMMAQLRAIENRRYVARAAGTGISALIDPCGRIVQEVGLFQQSAIIGYVAPQTRLTLYTRWGQWFTYLCAAMLIACLCLLPRVRSRSSAAGTPLRENAQASESPQHLP